MATSGSTSVAVTSYDTMTISWTLNSQSTANNTSNITFKAVLTSTSGGAIYSSASKSYTATINGTSYSGTNTVGISANSSLTLFSKTLDIAHDSSGAKSFTFSYSQEFSITFSGSSIGTKSGSLTVTPTTIARASSLSSITSSLTTGTSNNMAVVFTPLSTSFYYKVAFTVGSNTYTSGAYGPYSSTSTAQTLYFTFSDAWAAYITSATSATGTCVLYTYSNSACSTLVGSSSKTFTLNVSSSCVPTATISSVTEGNSTISSSGISVFISGKSKLKVAVTATMSYSSAISSISVVIGSTTYSGSLTTTSTGATTTVTGSAVSATSVTITVTVKDKRGRSGTATVTKTQYAYTSPTISTFTAVRCDSSGTADSQGEYVKVSYNYSMTSVTGNSASAKIDWKLSSASSYSNNIYSATSYSDSGSVTKGGFSIESGYNFRLTLTDALGSATKIISVSTASAVLDIYKDGTGLAIGTVAEESNLLDVEWQIRAANGISTNTLTCTDTGGSISTDQLVAPVDIGDGWYVMGGFVFQRIWAADMSTLKSVPSGYYPKSATGCGGIVQSSSGFFPGIVKINTDGSLNAYTYATYGSGTAVNCLTSDYTGYFNIIFCYK